MTEKQLKTNMNLLFDELEKSNDKINDKKIIAKAVNLGMKYQEDKIKEGIKETAIQKEDAEAEAEGVSENSEATAEEDTVSN